MKKVATYCFNKYTATLMLFLVWMTFFDQNDWMSQRETRKQLEETKEHIRFLTEQTAQLEKDYQLLKNDPSRLEQYAREHYRMKKDNEDLYVIERN